MSFDLVGAALAGASLIQALGTEALGNKCEPMSRAFLRDEFNKDPDNELGLPQNQEQRDYLVDVASVTAGLGASAIATAAALCTSVVGSFTTLVIASVRAQTALVIIMAVASIVALGAASLLFVRIASAHVSPHAHDVNIPRRRKNKSEEPRTIKRWGWNTNTWVINYRTNVKRLHVLTPYKSALFAVSATCIVVSLFL
ncbi:hypothetical protein [Streptomyces sp. NPDC018693]|uniref:hypothetical protein n=1 Tax=unclassified Streptomyces TaxID=2593676 RepID=UPI0037923CAD